MGKTKLNAKAAKAAILKAAIADLCDTYGYEAVEEAITRYSERNLSNYTAHGSYPIPPCRGRSGQGDA